MERDVLSIFLSFACGRFTLFSCSHLPKHCYLIYSFALYLVSSKKKIFLFPSLSLSLALRFLPRTLFLNNITMQFINRELNNMNEQNERNVKAGRYWKGKTINAVCRNY